MMHAIHEYRAIINYYKWKALISFMGKRKRKKKDIGGKKEKKKNSCVCNP